MIERCKPDAAVADIQSNLVQFLGHPWPTVAAQTDTGLFFDVYQRHQITALSAAVIDQVRLNANLQWPDYQ